MPVFDRNRPSTKTKQDQGTKDLWQIHCVLLVGCKLHVVSSSGVIFADFSIILVGIFKSASTVVGNYYTNLFAILCDVINDEVDKNERENAVQILSCVFWIQERCVSVHVCRICRKFTEIETQ